MASERGNTVDLVVLRHFPTAFNAGEGGKEKSRSWSRIGVDRDAADPLADKAAKVFDRLGVGSITSSDLPRGAQSAKMVAERMKEYPELTATSRARTWNTGEAGKPEKEAREQRKKYAQEPDVPMPGGESFGSFENRFGDFVRGEVKKAERNPDEKRALVLHGHQVMHSENVLNGEPAEDKDFDKLDEIKPGHIMILRMGPGGAELVPVND